MPRPYPEEFRRDVVAVARQRKTPLSQIARDLGISEATLHNWLRKAEVEEGLGPGVTRVESDQLPALKRRNRLLERENDILRRAAAFSARELPPK